MLDRYDENLILGYIENDLDADDRARFEAMLAEDQPLQLLIEQLIADRALLRAVPAKAAPTMLMEQVQGQLERQMLVDVAPHRVARPASPVIHRFPSRLRWAGGLAAALALAAGLTWHFDPMGWFTTTQPIGELAHHVASPDADKIESLDKSNSHANRQALQPAAPIADATPANSKQATGPLEQQSKTNGDGMALRGNKDADLQGGAPSAVKNAQDESGASAAATVPPGGKATAALALANDAAGAAPSSPAVMAADNIKERTAVAGSAAAKADMAATAGDVPAAAAAPAPDFQIELQTASVSQTRQLLLAWADQNDAVEALPASARRSRAMQLGAATGGQAAEAEKLRSDRSRERDQSPADELKKSKAPDEARPTSPADGAAGSPIPTPAPSIAPPAAPAPGAKLAAKPHGAAANVSEEREAVGKSSLADGDQNRHGLASAEAAKLPATEQAITLLVPADRVDSLVEHIEAKTGQSLVVVRTGDQTLLLSPQVANQRALARKEVDKVEKSAATLADAAVEIESSPVEGPPKLDAASAARPAAVAPAAKASPVAPPAPTAPDTAATLPQPTDKALADSKDASPKAKKAAARQVMVKIILAEEAK